MRMITHVAFSVILFLIIIIFNALNKESILKNLFIMSGYTYGPLLGLYSFGILTKRRIRDEWSIVVCILAPVISYFINTNSEILFDGFQFGYLNIALNGLLAFIGIWIISLKPKYD